MIKKIGLVILKLHKYKKVYAEWFKSILFTSYIN